jgi:O-glycosyl hydrolase
VTHQIGLHGVERGFGGFASAAHFAQTDDSVIGFYFNDGADEAAPVASVRVPEWSFQRDCDRGSANVRYLHGFSTITGYTR